ncbi:hypothetical protein MKW92_029782 [Papaver armeniacum]|nr:hypothetical protein MKW92_029782 [Papaver armeniacum]
MSKRLVSESSSSCSGMEPIVAWWDKCNPAKFRQEFRMNWSTFDFICNELQPFSITNKKKVSTSDFRRNVAAFIWNLASGQPNKDVEAKFGLTYTQCRVSLNTFVGSLMQKYVKWPDESEMVNIKTEFERVSGVENIVGSINTTRIQIAGPNSETFITADPYYDYELSARQSGRVSFSIALQGVVNHKGVFTDIFIGQPGSLDDYHVYQRSPLRNRVLQGAWIVGTDKFPLMDKILVPYIDYANLTPTQRTFDTQLYQIESIAREACLRLKSRWLILKRETDHPTLETIEETVKACCTLHNICAIKNDDINLEWRSRVEDNFIIPEPPVVSETARKERDALAEYLAEKLRL